MASPEAADEVEAPDDAQRAGGRCAGGRGARHHFVAARPGTSSPPKPIQMSPLSAPKPPSARPPPHVAGLRQTSVARSSPSSSRSKGRATMPDTLSNAATATGHSDSSALDGTASPADDWSTSSGDESGPSDTEADVGKGAKHVQARGRTEAPAQREPAEMRAASGGEEEEDSEREASLSPFEPIEQAMLLSGGLGGKEGPGGEGDERGFKPVALMGGGRGGGGSHESKESKEEFERERDAMLTRLRKRQEDSGIALASMSQGVQSKAGAGEGEGGASKAERRRERIAAILSDEERVKSLLRRHYAAERRTSEDNVDAVLAGASEEGVEDGLIDGVTEEDRARVRERLREMASAKMFSGHAYGMAALLSHEGDAADPRDVTDDDVHVHSLRCAVVQDTEEAPHFLQPSKVRPGPGGALQPELFPWRGQLLSVGEKALGGKASAEEGVRGEDSDEDTESEDEARRRVESLRGEGAAKQGDDKRGSISRKLSGLGAGVSGLFKGKKYSSGDSSGEAVPNGGIENGFGKEIPRHVAQKCLQEGFEMDLPNHGQMMMGILWKFSKKNGAMGAPVVSWRVRLFFVDEEHGKLLYCKDPEKRRILRITAGDKLQPHKIRVQCITSVAHIKVGSLEGEPVPGACFGVTWKHPDFPPKTLALCAQNVRDADRWVDKLNLLIQAERKVSVGALGPGTISSGDGLGYLAS